MLGDRLSNRLSVYRSRIRRALTDAFEEEHTPQEVAASFAIGIFVTAMPTGGLGIGLFFLLAYYFEWVSKTAIFASVAVMNPFVKPVVYLASYQVGAILLGTEPLVVFDHGLLDTAVGLIQAVVIGNLLIALALAAVSYIVVLRWTRAHRRRRDRNGEEVSPHAVLVSLRQRWWK